MWTGGQRGRFRLPVIPSPRTVAWSDTAAARAGSIRLLDHALRRGSDTQRPRTLAASEPSSRGGGQATDVPVAEPVEHQREKLSRDSDLSGPIQPVRRRERCRRARLPGCPACRRPRCGDRGGPGSLPAGGRPARAAHAAGGHLPRQRGIPEGAGQSRVRPARRAAARNSRTASSAWSSSRAASPSPTWAWASM